MNWKKAILYGLALWVFVFVVISVIMFIPALADELTWQTILDLIAIAVLVLIFGSLYFKKHAASFGRGLLIGIVWAIVSTILDLAITVPLFIMPKDQGYGDFYSEWNVWAGLSIIIILAGLSAVLFSKKGEIKSVTQTAQPQPMGGEKKEQG